jgi:hypothetical protein
LRGYPSYVLIKDVEELIVVEFGCDERFNAVYGVIGRGNIIDSHITYDNGEHKTDDRGEYLTAVSAGLSLLQVQVLYQKGLYLVAALLLALHTDYLNYHNNTTIIDI